MLATSPRETPGLQKENYNFLLGIEPFTYLDLFKPGKLLSLTELFYHEVETQNSSLWNEFRIYLNQKGKDTSSIQVSSFITRMAPYLSRFICKLFQIESQFQEAASSEEENKEIFRFKKDFVKQRILKKYETGNPPEWKNWNASSVNNQIELIRGTIDPGLPWQTDEEKATAILVNRIFHLQTRYIAKISAKPPLPVEIKVREETRKWIDSLKAHADPLSASIHFPRHETDRDELQFLESFLELWEKYLFLRYKQNELKDWVSFRFPHPMDFQHLVQIENLKPETREMATGPEETYRRRVGFTLTDERMKPREVLSEVDYCIFCHERDKDFCSKGFLDPAKKPPPTPSIPSANYKKNPLGIPLTGCPLDEKISEAHFLKNQGDPIGALAAIMIDNPMAPGTGHRICNDCMKSCIYQKQDPVNIPQIETGILTDVLGLPYGFEIYSLLTRWNPLNVQRPYPLPYHGRNILVVGMGPAGYTLTHYLLNEGFAVVGIDGLKIEPLPADLVGDTAHEIAPKPIKSWKEIYHKLDERVLLGFGGVSEYGITARWDKNFLMVVYLNLLRREQFRVYGGVRFGGTITIEDAWEMGFDHIAIATGAGKPTIINMKNNLIRGIRKASDFLMALQLTGAAKKSSIANLQVQLPAIVIGGGLTAIDTATELMAYYPSQVEKALDRFEKLVHQFGEERVWKDYDPEEKQILRTFLEHGKDIRNERERARLAGEKPNFIPFVRQWGGVGIAYRKSMIDSPAYRLNHEEIIKALEEGIYFYERLSPIEAVPDEFGAVGAITFERQELVEGKWKRSNQTLTLPAKCVMVAAGTSPNVIYEKERPGTFQMDEEGYFFQCHKPIWEEDGMTLKPMPQLEKTNKGEISFFTSYHQDGKYITYYGDNHPEFAGNVVKAMASARYGYPNIVKLFEKDVLTAEHTIHNLEHKISETTNSLFTTRFNKLITKLDTDLTAHIHQVIRLTPTIVEVIVHAPLAARKFEPGQFYRLQNYETDAIQIEDTRLAMEGLALTGAWVDKEKGFISTIVLEMGGSSRLCASLKPGQRIVLMGPTGYPTEIPQNETVLLAGGGLGNAVLFSIGKGLKEKNNRVIYFAAYKKKEDMYKREEIESSADEIIWSVDAGALIEPHRPQDKTFRGNVVQAIQAYGDEKLGKAQFKLHDISRIIAIGSDRMMGAVKTARKQVLAPYLRPDHVGIGSINSTMQCMMKEVCAQCLQKHVDPETQQEKGAVFSCFNQDQLLDEVDFVNLNERLKMNSVLEKQTNLWIDYLFTRKKISLV